MSASFHLLCRNGLEEICKASNAKVRSSILNQIVKVKGLPAPFHSPSNDDDDDDGRNIVPSLILKTRIYFP